MYWKKKKLVFLSSRPVLVSSLLLTGGQSVPNVIAVFQCKWLISEHMLLLTIQSALALELLTAKYNSCWGACASMQSRDILCSWADKCSLKTLYSKVNMNIRPFREDFHHSEEWNSENMDWAASQVTIVQSRSLYWPSRMQYFIHTRGERFREVLFGIIHVLVITHHFRSTVHKTHISVIRYHLAVMNRELSIISWNERV